MKYVSCQTNQRASLDHIAQHIACVSTCCSLQRKEKMFFSCLVSENNKYFSNEATKGGGKKKCKKGE